MNRSNYLAIDNPNIPVVDVPNTTNVTYNDFLSTPVNNSGGLDPCEGSVRLKDMYHTNFSLREYKGHFNRQALLINEEGVALDHVGVCLFLKGEVQSFLKDSEDVPDPSFSNSQNYKYDPGNECIHVIPANKPFHIAHFSVKIDFFDQLLPQEENWADRLRTSVYNKERLVGNKFSPILAAQINSLQNIYDCPLTGKLGYLMMETSLVQIILLQMHSLFNEKSPSHPKTNKRDLDLIHAVKEFITLHFLDDHSLTNLAKRFGTNRNKLMSLFRQQFGKSIFDHLSDHRMAYAKEILHQSDTSVSEVAHNLGYKNANHFSTAFKKKYAISPSQIKR